MQVVLNGCAVLFVVLIGVPGYAAERLVPYDDFNTTHIDPAKWFGGEFGGAGTEAIRQIQDNRLHLVYRSSAKTDSDRGRPRNELGLIFRNSAAVTAIKAAVQVTDAAATRCPSNPEATIAWAMLGGLFFNTATYATPGSAVNDVGASIHIVRRSDSTDPPDVFRVRSGVFHCANAACTAVSELHFQDLGSVQRGEMARLRVQWDRDKHRFIFQRDDNPEVFAPYTVSDSAPPGIQVKLLDALHLVPNCTATPRPVAFIEALFDDVLVNESAAPHTKNANDLAMAADWVLIPGGKFVMGATADQQADFYTFGGSPQWMRFAQPLVESSGPAHDVHLDSFYIFRHEVTNSQYQKFVSAMGHRNSGSVSDPRFNGPHQPVVTVTWNDAQSFCVWIGARLPTEAEWEKAARGTGGFIYPWGNTWDAAKLRSMDGIARQALPSIEEWENWRKQHMRNTPEAKPADVGSYPEGASPYGVMDMAGNVWEWVADWFDPTYYANAPKDNPKGPESGEFRVLRGGAWDTPIPVNFTWLRQTFMPPSDARAVTGFRCAKDYTN